MSTSICPRCSGNCRASAQGFIRCTDCAWEGRVSETGDSKARAAQAIKVARVTARPAEADDDRRGLIGYVTAHLVGGLVLDGMTLRRTMHGRRVLTWPARRDRMGQDHPLYRLPGSLNAEIERQAIEILAPLRSALRPVRERRLPSEKFGSGVDDAPGRAGGREVEGER